MTRIKAVKTAGKKTTEPRRSKLTQLAYEKIKKAIVSNKLKPGLPISGSLLANHFKMSRTPIREAIQLLANDGLVEIKNGVGFYIKALTLTELKDINEVRIALQCAALKVAINVIATSDLEKHLEQWRELAQQLQAAQGPANQEMIDRIVVMDNETHKMITSACGNKYMLELLEDVEIRSTQVQYLAVDAGCALSTVEQHIEIIEAMLENNLAKAKEKLEFHIKYAVAHIERNADYWAAGADPQFLDSYFNSVFGNL